MSSLNYLINVESFVKQYNQVKIEIENLLITNRITLLIGENGCGKSTILKAIAELITFEGEIQITKSVKYMPEKSQFPFDVTVYQFLSSLCALNDSSFDDMMSLVLKFELEDKLNEKLSKLSKGMKAKVDLINVLNSKETIFLLDEPLSGLDFKSVELLIQYIKQSPKNFVIASHHLGRFHELNADVISL